MSFQAVENSEQTETRKSCLKEPMSRLSAQKRWQHMRQLQSWPTAGAARRTKGIRCIRTGKCEWGNRHFCKPRVSNSFDFRVRTERIPPNHGSVLSRYLLPLQYYWRECSWVATPWERGAQMGNLLHYLANILTTADDGFSKLTVFSRESLKLQQVSEIGQRKPSCLS